VTPDELAQLEEERSFLLRSLDDLERERDAGDVDDGDYASLRDDYVARAAIVLREIDTGAAPVPARPERRRGRIAVGVVAVLVLAVVAGWLVSRWSGQRLPGQTITGGGAADSTSALLSQARSLGFSDPVQSIELYSQVLQVDPDNVEALTYRAWLLGLSSSGASDDVQELALEQVRADLARAIELDVEYPDAHCFSGILEFRYGGDPAVAKDHLEQCQSFDPPAEVQGFVDAIISEVDAALASGTAPTSTAP
jgi:hypothetical protein